MKPIRLNRKLTLEGPVQSPDGAGGFSENWSILGVHWAQVKTGRGKLRALGDTVVSQTPTEIVVRGAALGASARPRAEQRFREGSRSWRVVAVTELDPYGRYLRCDAIEEAVA